MGHIHNRILWSYGRSWDRDRCWEPGFKVLNEYEKSDFKKPVDDHD